MATFAPEVRPTSDPSYISYRYQRPVEAPRNLEPTGVMPNNIYPEGDKVVDRSAEFAGEAAAAGAKAQGVGYQQMGDIFSGLVQGADYMTKVGDTLIKQDISDKVYDIANAERERFTSDLEAMRGKPGGTQSLLDANDSMDMPGGQQELPGELKNLQTSLSSLTTANAAGKLTGTMYMGRLAAMAKDLRSKYPGYRDYIDNQFSQVVGQNPANAYVRGLMSDLNSGLTGAKAEQNRMLSFVNQRLGYAGAQEQVQNIMNGTATWNSLSQWAIPYEKKEYDQKAKAADFQSTQNDVALSKIKAESYASNRLDTATNAFIDNIKVPLPNGGTTNVMDFLQRAQAGEFTEAQVRHVGEVMTGLKPMLTMNLQKNMSESTSDLSTTGGVQLGGNNPNGILNIQRSRELITNAVSRYEDLITAMYDKDKGAAFAVANHLKAQDDDLSMRALNFPDTADYFQAQRLIRANGGDQAVSAFISATAAGQGVYPKIQNFVHTNVANAAAQPDPNKPFTLNKIFDNAQIAAKSGVPEVGSPKALLASMEGVKNLLTNPNIDDTTRMNAVKAAFSEGNFGFINRIQDDSKDPVTGRTIPGRYWAFRELTSDKMSRMMNDFGQTHPEAWANYQNWVENTFANDLFSRDLNSLKNIQVDKNISVGWQTGQGFYLIRRPDVEDKSTASQNQAQYVQGVLNRLNTGIQSLYGLQKADSSFTPEEFVLGELQKFGVTPTAVGIPASMQKSILDAQQRQDNANKIKKDQLTKMGKEFLGQ